MEVSGRVAASNICKLCQGCVFDDELLQHRAKLVQNASFCFLVNSRVGIREVES